MIKTPLSNEVGAGDGTSWPVLPRGSRSRFHWDGRGEENRGKAFNVVPGEGSWGPFRPKGKLNELPLRTHLLFTHTGETWMVPKASNTRTWTFDAGRLNVSFVFQPPADFSCSIHVCNIYVWISWHRLQDHVNIFLCCVCHSVKLCKALAPYG